MSLFWTDSIVLCYANVPAAKQWWVHAFDCKETKPPADWDNPLPSDVAMILPGEDEPRLLLCSITEIESAGVDRPRDRPILFCHKLKKAEEYFQGKGVLYGPIQDGGDTEFFEV